jgi:hypothetical protein
VCRSGALLWLWALSDGPTDLPRDAPVEMRGATFADFLPDGRLLTFHGHAGVVNLWPAEALR